MDKPLLDYQSGSRASSKARIDVTIYLRCYYGAWVVGLAGWAVAWVLDIVTTSPSKGLGVAGVVRICSAYATMLLFLMSLWTGGLCLSNRQISAWAYLLRILAVVLALSLLASRH